MKRQRLTKIVSAIAISGFGLVIVTLLSRFVFEIKVAEKNTMLILGFTLMLLGTLWKVVLEMNSPDE